MVPRRGAQSQKAARDQWQRAILLSLDSLDQAESVGGDQVPGFNALLQATLRSSQWQKALELWKLPQHGPRSVNSFSWLLTECEQRSLAGEEFSILEELRSTWLWAGEGLVLLPAEPQVPGHWQAELKKVRWEAVSPSRRSELLAGAALDDASYREASDAAFRRDVLGLGEIQNWLHPTRSRILAAAAAQIQKLLHQEDFAHTCDSKSGLNAKLAKSGMGPKDFSFLLEGSDAKVTSLEAATPFGARRLELPRRSSEKPNGRRQPSAGTQAGTTAPSPRKAGPKKRPPVTLPQAFPQKSNKSDLREAAFRSRPGPCSETGSSVQSEVAGAWGRRISGAMGGKNRWFFLLWT
eukprot:s673_g9.t2